MEQEREILTWAAFDTAVRDLDGRIAADGVPDTIRCIARGGLLVGGTPGHALGMKNTSTMNVEFSSGVDQRLEVPRILPPAPDFVDLGEARLPVADHVWRDTDRWVTFPWSDRPPVTGRGVVDA